MNVDINKIAKKFKNKIGDKAKVFGSVEHNCFKIRITKSMSKQYILNVLNELCVQNKFKQLNTEVSSPSVKKGKHVIGVSSIAKLSPFKEVAVFVYFK